MGGVLKRIEFFVAGDALQRALGALRATSKDNSVAVSSEVWKMISEQFQGEADEVAATSLFERRNTKVDAASKLGRKMASHFNGYIDENAKYFFVKKTFQQIRIVRDHLLRKNEIDEKKIKKIENHVKSYIPGGFRSLINLKTHIGEQIGQHI